MLVLRRVPGQSIVIGEKAEIIIKILNDENGTVSVGIAAPQSVQVDRLEVFEKRLRKSPLPNESILNRLKAFTSKLIKKTCNSHF